MDEIRSWDRQIGPQDSTNLTGSVRVVVWPKGAPKQEDVPQAGEKVRKGHGTYTVVTGIPYKAVSGRWHLELLSTVGSINGHLVGSFKPIPSTPAQTYTEDEIREALNEHYLSDKYLANEIIGRLKELFKP